MRQELETLRLRLRMVRSAYLRGQPCEGRHVSYEDLRRVAEEYITKSYELQKVLYGRVKVRISVAKLLRLR